MRVLSNTSPLMALAVIGKQELLPALFGEVVVTPAVLEELEAGGPGAPGADARNWPWLVHYWPQNADAVRVLAQQLDRGEAQTLAAALETRPDLVLLDETIGRRVAANLGVAVLGTIGVLLDAKRRGLIPALRPLLDHLRNDAGFWMSDALYRQALIRANESTQ